jgi:hypothetical protein
LIKAFAHDPMRRDCAAMMANRYPHREVRMIRHALVLLAIAALPAQAATNPRLSALQIEIWPEYDRPQALVILKGELAADAALPAALNLRLPGASGGPSAVAYENASGKLLNLGYRQEDAGGFVAVRFELPGRSFHVEFYDPLPTGKPEREYRYVWPADLAVERLSVLVKEPAAAGNFVVQPRLDVPGVSPDGLKHRAAALGAFEAGQQLPIEIRYTKTDARTSTAILGAAASDTPRAQSDAPPPALPRVLIAAGVVVLLAAVGALVWRRRGIKPAARYCPKCGGATKQGDRFCASCGAALG